MSNPGVTFRVSPADRKRLDDIVARSGKSLGRVLHELLGLAERDEVASYNRGFADGEKLGVSRGLEQGRIKHEILFRCCVCGKGDLVIEPNSAVHQAVANALHAARWGHKKCLAHRNE